MQQPPAKPRRPAPDARALPMARKDIVPGVPKQAPSPAALAAAREASRDQSRPSSPEVQDVRMQALDHRMGIVEKRVDDMADSQERVAASVGTILRDIGELKLTAADSESVKVREEQKTKRWVAVIGLITMIVAPAGTITANQLTREAPQPVASPVVQSSMQKQWEDKCTEAPSEQAWAECIRDVALANAPTRRR